ncbi:MAG: UDP-N-acetylmuramoyl-L-alanyl-D-glutamate--2,6-diaminopimelate ligase, partial [Spirochaetales bacterium]|nr:UDP-N-acetylmuramoyl-L-alanyl-D-glutamate--2,6-diaminopimelate ligase [Spirochaetales bacterium]
MTTKDLLSRISGNVKIARDYEISSLCYDSRDCILHSAFFCFKGTRTDGNLFIRKAIQNGARCIITDQEIREELPDDVSYAVTRENTRRCYAIASGAFFQNPARSMKVIGVTGTDGKSSTSYFIYQLLLALGHRCGLSSTVSVDNGSGLRNAPWRQSTPEAFLLHSFLKQAKDNRCEYMVIEATSHALSTEYDRLAGIHFDTSCITRISSEHLDFHRTLKNYVSSKLRLFRNTKNSAFVYENNDLNGATVAVTIDK